MPVKPSPALPKRKTSLGLAPGDKDLIGEFPEHTPENVHAVARNWVMERGNATGHEHMAGVDVRTGQVVHASTMSHPSMAGYLPGAFRFEPRHSLVWHQPTNPGRLTSE